MQSALLSDLRTQAFFLCGCAAVIAVGGFFFGQRGADPEVISLPFGVEETAAQVPGAQGVPSNDRVAGEVTAELSGPQFSIDPVDPVSEEQTIVVSGTATSGTRVFTSAAQAELLDGRWSVSVVLVAGDNDVLIEGLGANGEIASETFSVRYEPGSLPDVAFSAEQRFLASQDPEPWEYFSGTATPLSTVTLSSDYGTASTVADSEGNWESAIFFDAPGSDQPFAVVVEAANGTATFGFTFQPTN